ncbi:MAG: hypothetical protein AAGA95_20420 [Pseudomonadota bacterium]
MNPQDHTTPPQSDGPAQASVPLAQLFYDIAYFTLPNYLYTRDASVFSVLSTAGQPHEITQHLYKFLLCVSASCKDDSSWASRLFYVSACHNRGVDANREQLPVLKWHTCIDFVNDLDCFVLEFPRLPSPRIDRFGDPMDVFTNPEKLMKSMLAHPVALPPIYAAVLCPASHTMRARHRDGLPFEDGPFEGHYVIQGVSPEQGTTYRTVLADGSNRRLAIGPDEPSLEDFLKTLYANFREMPVAN